MAPEWNFSDLKTFARRDLRHARMFSTQPCSGPRLLFVHGGFHGAWCWSLFLRFFEGQGIPAAALDLRGHGGLPQGADFIGSGMNDMIADVVEAAGALTGDIILAGHSMGALVAMAAAQQTAPKGLVLMAPAAPKNVPLLRALPAFPTDVATAAPAEARARKWFLSGFSGNDLAPYMERLCPESPVFLNDVYQTRVEVSPTWVKGPTLCLAAAADDSPLHGAGQDAPIAQLFDAELHTIPRAGHCMMLDDTWETAAGIIAQWWALRFRS